MAALRTTSFGKVTSRAVREADVERVRPGTSWVPSQRAHQKSDSKTKFSAGGLTAITSVLGIVSHTGSDVNNGACWCVTPRRDLHVIPVPISDSELAAMCVVDVSAVVPAGFNSSVFYNNGHCGLH